MWSVQYGPTTLCSFVNFNGPVINTVSSAIRHVSWYNWLQNGSWIGECHSYKTNFAYTFYITWFQWPLRKHKFGWWAKFLFYLTLLLFDFLRWKVSQEHNYCVIAEQIECRFCIHIINKNNIIQNASWTIPFGRLKEHLHSPLQLYVGLVLTVLPEKHRTHSQLQKRVDT